MAHTIQEALTHLIHPQLVADEVLHVKRFCYDVSVGGVAKVMKQVRLDPSWRLDLVRVFVFSHPL